MNKIKGAINKYKNASVELRASVAYTICNVFQNCLGFITLPIFSRLLSTDEYGNTINYTSWQGIFVMILTLSLAYGSFNTAMVKFEDRRKEYVSNIQGIVATISLIFVAIYLPFQDTFNSWFEMPTAMVLFLVLEINLQNAIVLWSGRQRFVYNYRPVIAVTLLMSLLSPIASFIMIKSVSGDKGYIKLIGNIVVLTVIGGSVFLYNFKEGKRIFTKEFWIYALKFNIPLLPYYMSQTIFNQSDKIMITHISGKADAALYGIPYSLAMVLNFVLNSINNSYVPWLYERIKTKDRKPNQKIACYIVILMSALLFLVILGGPEFIYVFSGKKYMEAIWVIPPVAMCLLLLFYSQLFINVEFFFEKKNLLVFGTAGSAVANVVLNALFIPIFGYVVAAYTTLISYIMFAGFNYFCYLKTIKEQNLPQDLYNTKALLLICFVFMGMGFGVMALYELPIIRYVIVGVLMILALIFRKRLIAFYQVISKKNTASQH